MRLKNIRSRPGGVSGQRGPGKGLRIQSPRLEGETRQRRFPGGRRGRVTGRLGGLTGGTVWEAEG